MYEIGQVIELSGVQLIHWQTCSVEHQVADI